MNAVVTDTHNVTSNPASDWFRTFLWLIKRELWEHRGRFLITPLVVSAIVIIGTLYGVMQLNDTAVSTIGEGIRLNTPGVKGEVVKGFHFASTLAFAMPFAIVMFFVTLHYTMDTLYADRRDRSILFWKSLPVSDFDTVLSKLSIATFVAPVIMGVMVLVTQYLSLGLFSIGLAANGGSPGQLWSDVPFFQNILLHVYLLIGVGLWYLPIWAWCMLASAWAQRAVFLWATVPVAGLAYLEYLTLGTRHVLEFIRIRFSGMAEVMVNVPASLTESLRDQKVTTVNLSDFLTPGAYFSSPHLWIGLVMTAGLVTAIIWLRRYRETA